MDDVRLTPGLVTLLSLAGTWSGAGTAELPAMEAIAFEEEIRFTRRSATSLDYWQRARAQADGSMLHSESGIWRTTELGTLEVSVALPGATEVSEGTVERQTLRLSSTMVGRAATAATLSHVERRYEISDGSLVYDISIATADFRLTGHIRGRLRRVEDHSPRER